MNYRRALRAATDAGLAIFLIMMVGVVLWTTDEVLNWNILPDWIDKFAQVIIIVLAILAGFSVVISVMCSFAVIAESAAAKAGIAEPVSSRRVRGSIAFGIILVFGSMFALHKFDQYRAEKRREAAEQRALARKAEAEESLTRSMGAIVALFSPAVIAPGVTTEGGEELARLLTALRASTPFQPEVGLLLPAGTPYKYCVITAVPEERPNPREPPPPPRLKRQFLTDFPSEWEGKVVEAIFRGEQPMVPAGKEGVVIDGRKPIAWGPIRSEGRVVGVILLQAQPDPNPE